MAYLADRGLSRASICSSALEPLRGGDVAASARSASRSTTASRTSPSRRCRCSSATASARPCSSPPASPTGASRSPGTGRQPPVLGWEDVVALDREGTLRFEAHTVSHPSLRRGRRRGRRRGDRRVAARAREAGSGRRVSAFAYPPGSTASASAGSSAQAGYTAAVSCEPGVNRPGGDPFALRRRQIDSRDRLVDFKAKVGGGHDSPLPLRATYRRLRYGMPESARRRARDGRRGGRRDRSARVPAPGRPRRALDAGRGRPAGAPARCASAAAIAGRDEQPRLAVRDQLRDAADVGGDDREPGGHRLEDRERRALRARSRARTRRPPPAAPGRRRARRAASTRSASRCARSSCLDPRAVAAVADEGERVTGAGRAPAARAPASADPSGAASRPTVTIRGGSPASGARGARLDVDRVGDHHGPARAAGPRGQPGGALGLRHADRHRGQRRQQAVRPAIERGGEARRRP